MKDFDLEQFFKITWIISLIGVVIFIIMLIIGELKFTKFNLIMLTICITWSCLMFVLYTFSER